MPSSNSRVSSYSLRCVYLPVEKPPALAVFTLAPRGSAGHDRAGRRCQIGRGGRFATVAAPPRRENAYSSGTQASPSPWIPSGHQRPSSCATTRAHENRLPLCRAFSVSSAARLSVRHRLEQLWRGEAPPPAAARKQVGSMLDSIESPRLAHQAGRSRISPQPAARNNQLNQRRAGLWPPK
jgi:hypothetical protein